MLSSVPDQLLAAYHEAGGDISSTGFGGHALDFLYDDPLKEFDDFVAALAAETQHSTGTTVVRTAGELPVVDPTADRERDLATPDYRRLYPIRDQGNFDACIGFSCAGLIEFVHWKQSGSPAHARQVLRMSPLFVWYFARLFALNADVNTGAWSRNGMRVLAKVGCCLETSAPYDPVAYIPPPVVDRRLSLVSQMLPGLNPILDRAASRRPTDAAIAEAQEYRLREYYWLKGRTEMKQCLKNGYPFVAAIPIYNSTRTQLSRLAQAAGAGDPMPIEEVPRLPDPPPPPIKETPEWHTVLVVGYSDADSASDPAGQSFICRDSTGTGLTSGYFRLPYTYVPDPQPAGPSVPAQPWPSDEDRRTLCTDGWTALHVGR